MPWNKLLMFSYLGLAATITSCGDDKDDQPEPITWQLVSAPKVIKWQENAQTDDIDARFSRDISSVEKSRARAHIYQTWSPANCRDYIHATAEDGRLAMKLTEKTTDMRPDICYLTLRSSAEDLRVSDSTVVQFSEP